MMADVLILSLGAVVSILLGGVFSHLILDWADLEQKSHKASIFIGILERLLVFIFVWLGEYVAISILIAIKAAVPINPGVEYEVRHRVVLGTLSSVTWAVSITFLTKWAWGA